MSYNRYLIRPIQHGINRAYPSLHTPSGFSPWAQNGRIDQHSFRKRWGYTLDRTLPSKVLNMVLYQQWDGTRNTLYLTATDLCHKETGTGETFSYKTDSYTTGTIASLNPAKTIITGNAGTNWATSGAAAGDKFIIDADLSANIEDDANWATIGSVDGDTQITLSAAYTGSATSGAYRIRKVYSVPTGERWSWAIVNDTFCFTNGNVDVQKWTGTGYATAVDTTNAKQARYCIEYANRLVLADLQQGGARSPITVAWSGEGDPTHWNPATDDTAGVADLLESEDYITGLGRVGSSLVVYRRDNLHIGNETGVSTAPIEFPTRKRGFGMIAPYGLIEAMGTNMWLGRDDFYIMGGTSPQSIGEPVRNLFFDTVETTEAQNTWGWFDALNTDCHWVATTTSGQYDFVYNPKYQEWVVFKYANDMVSAGRGAI